jgi:hypothetical protein
LSLTVPNLQAALTNAKGLVVQPWNTFFQQFVQAPSAASSVSAAGNSYTAKEPGTLSVAGATSATFTRGSNSVAVTGSLIPVEINDVVSWVGNATVTFFPRY